MSNFRGLLDALRDPKNSQGLLDMGVSLMGASGPSPVPMSFGQRFAQGYMGSQQMAAERAAAALKKQYMEAQIAQMNAPAQRRIVQGPDGNSYYENGDRVLPGVDAAPKPAAPPPRTTIRRGDKDVTQEWDAKAGQWKDVAEGAAWKPETAAPRGAGYSAPREGINPATGKPDTYTMDDQGNIKWLGIAPNTPAKLKSLPASAINSLAEAGSTAQDFSRLRTSFKDGYGGYKASALGEIANAYKRNIGGDDTGQAQWWQDYQTQKNTIRNRLFGSALTATEKSEFDKAMIDPGMTDEAIKKNLARQEAIAMRAARKLGEAYSKGQYDPEQVEGALGVSLQDLAAAPDVPAAGGSPPKRLKFEELPQ